jgi:hypothetical protein
LIYKIIIYEFNIFFEFVKCRILNFKRKIIDLDQIV